MRRDLVLIAAYLAAFGALTATLAAGGPLLDLDLAATAWADAHRPTVAEVIARVGNQLGQGSPLLVLSWALAEWRWLYARRLDPLGLVLAAALLVGASVVAVKTATERGAPSSPLPPEQVVSLHGPLPPGEYAASYPSGHVVNTVVWYGVLVLLLGALLRAYGRDLPVWLRVTIRVVPVALVLATTTYLSYHWLTDGLAGLALGLAIDRVLHLRRWRV